MAPFFSLLPALLLAPTAMGQSLFGSNENRNFITFGVYTDPQCTQSLRGNGGPAGNGGPVGAGPTLDTSQACYIHSYTDPNGTQQTNAHADWNCQADRVTFTQYAGSGYCGGGKRIDAVLTTQCSPVQTHMGLTYQKLIGYDQPCDAKSGAVTSSAFSQPSGPPVGGQSLPGNHGAQPAGSQFMRDAGGLFPQAQHQAGAGQLAFGGSPCLDGSSPTCAGGTPPVRGGVGPPSCPDGLAPRCADRGAPTLHQAGAQQPTMGHQPGQSMSSSSPYYAVASSQASGTGYGQYGNLQSAMFSPAASPSYGSSGNSNPYPVSLPSSLSSLSSFAYPGVPPTANAAPSSFTANPYGSFYAPSPSVSSYPSSFVSQPSGVSSYLSSFYSQSTGVSPAYLSSFYSQPGSRTAQQPGSSTVQFPANRGAAAYSPYLQSSSNLSPSPYNLGPYGIAGFAEAQTGGQSPSYSYNNYPSPASYSLSPASYSSSASYNPSLTSAASDSPSYSPSPAYSLRSSGMMIPRG